MKTPWIALGLFCAVQLAATGTNSIPKPASAAVAFDIKCREQGTLTATSTTGRAFLVIRGGGGIGEAAIRPRTGSWPPEIVLRVYLGGLESLTLSTGEVKLATSVLSHSGNTRLLHLWTNGREGPRLEKDSPYWMEIRTCDATGRPVNGLPPKGGWFEMILPTALHPGTNELRVSWINFYR